MKEKLKKYLGDLIFLLVLLSFLSINAYFINNNQRVVYSDFESEVEREIERGKEANIDISYELDETEDEVVEELGKKRGEYNVLSSNPFVSPIEERIEEKIKFEKELIAEEERREEQRRKEEQRRYEEEEEEEEEEEKITDVSRPNIEIQAIIGSVNYKRAVIFDHDKTFIVREGDEQRSILFKEITSEYVKIEYDDVEFKY